MAFKSGAAERIVRVEQTQEDPILPAKHKYTRVPRPVGLPPVTVLRSPPRPVSRKDWKILTRISNWKNPKGYSIPLDKWRASDGRGLQDVQICDAFAGLSEAFVHRGTEGQRGRSDARHGAEGVEDEGERAA